MQSSTAGVRDTDLLEDVVCILKPHLVKNLKTDLLLMSSSFDDIISRAKERQIMRMVRDDDVEGAAELFLDTLLQSQDAAKWSLFRNALDSPEHALIVDILERGVTEDLKVHEEYQRAVGLFRGPLVETLEPQLTTQYMLQVGLLTSTESQKVLATQRQHGDNMANFLLLTYIPRNKDWYLKFMKVLWEQNHRQLVRLIDPDVFTKFSTQDQEGNSASHSESVSPNRRMELPSEETAVKLPAQDGNSASHSESVSPHRRTEPPSEETAVKLPGNAEASSGSRPASSITMSMTEMSTDATDVKLLGAPDATQKDLKDLSLLEQLSSIKERPLNIGPAPEALNIPWNIASGRTEDDGDKETEDNTKHIDVRGESVIVNDYDEFGSNCLHTRASPNPRDRYRVEIVNDNYAPGHPMYRSSSQSASGRTLERPI